MRKAGPRLWHLCPILKRSRHFSDVVNILSHLKILSSFAFGVSSRTSLRTSEHERTIKEPLRRIRVFLGKSSGLPSTGVGEEGNGFILDT